MGPVDFFHLNGKDLGWTLYRQAFALITILKAHEGNHDDIKQKYRN